MAQQTMYPAMPNSPATELTAAITDTATTISVLDASKLPAAPNLATIGVDETAETVLYTGKSGNNLTGVTRGFSGTTAKAWAVGASVARYFTSYDADAMRGNISDFNAQLTIYGKQVPQVFNLKGYGAAGDGVTDDTAVFQSVLDTAYVAGGGVVFVPAGVYRTSATLVIKAGVRVVGAATSSIPLNLTTETVSGALIKPLSNYGNVFRLDKGASWAGVENLSIHYPNITPQSTSTPSTYAAIIFTIATQDSEYTNFVSIRNVDIIGMGQGIVMPWTKNTSLNYAQYYYTAIENVSFNRCKCGVFINGCSDIMIENIYCKDLFGMNLSTINGFIAPIVNNVNVASTTYSSTAQNLINDLGNSVINKFEVYGGVGDGLVIQDCVATALDNCTMASVSTHGLTIVGCTNNCRIYGLRSALCGQNGVEIQTSSQVNVTDLNFTDCRIENNYRSGVHGTPGSGKSISRIYFDKCHLTNNSLSSANAYYGVDLSATDVTFSACQLNDTQAVKTQRMGAYGNYTGADYWTFRDCDLTGNGFYPLFAGNNVEFRNCRGINNAAFSLPTPSLPTATGSANAVSNTGLTDVRIYITGGSGTHIVDRNSADRAIPDSTQVVLKRGEKIYFATAIPTSWAWYGL